MTIGHVAPTFSLCNQDSVQVSSKDLIGRKYILLFYPKDNTPTCTTELCVIRDNFKELKEQGWTLFGISRDSAKKHQNFINKLDLPFDLLVDDDLILHEAYDVWKEKTTFGKTYMGTIRSTFLINEIKKNTPFTIGNKMVEPIKAEHGKLDVFGFKIDNFVYLTDVKKMEADEIEKIKNKYPQKPLVIIANKVDKLSESQILNLKSQIENIDLLSAKNRVGVEALKTKLTAFVNTGALRNNDTIITNTRHYDSLLKALEDIEKVKQGLNSNLSGDLLAIDIRQALYHFGEITGEITNDDLLGNIFANFCIGK